MQKIRRYEEMFKKQEELEKRKIKRREQKENRRASPESVKEGVHTDALEVSEAHLLALPNVGAATEQPKAAKRPRIDSIGSNRSTRSAAAAKLGTQ
jgi:hypothetical protein